jgi:uncharacterized protein YjdB
VAPATATNKTVTWSSDHPEIAEVNAETGLITAKAAGVAVITVKTEDGNYTDTCTVTVNPATVSVTGVTLDRDAASLTVGGTTTLTATVAPATATNKTVTWSSDHPEIAEVNAETGLITAKAAGVAVITVTTEDGGKTATCTVNVSESLESAKAELTALLNQYAVKEDQSTLTATGYKLVIPTVYTAEDFNNVAVGKMYVEASKVTALNAAIDEAYRVLNTSSNVTEVRNEITNFKNTVNGINGAPGLVGVKPTVTLL